jgi:phage terminase small subunit
MTGKPLTIKQKKFVKAYAETGNGTKAALQSYDTTDSDTARAIASENLAKPTIRFAVEQALEKHGITMDAAIKPIQDALQAEKISISGQGDQAFAEVTPDHSIRLKASGMALKLMGADREQNIPASLHFHQHIEDKKAGYNF